MGRILALDYGDSRIGVAVSDESKTIATSPEPPVKNNQQVFDSLKNLIRKYEIEKIVLGLPKTMSGKESVACEKVKNFSANLQKKFRIKIEFLDERLTTKLASQKLHEHNLTSRKQKQHIDNQAAQILLSEFLD